MYLDSIRDKQQTKYEDFLFSVLSPIVLGILFYIVQSENESLIQVRNYLPDGLWAYGLTSCILIIWDRNINFFWISMIILFFISFELLQSLNFIQGTGDFFDIIVYIIFGLFAIGINQHKKTKKNT